MNERDIDRMIEDARKIADRIADGHWSPDAEVIRKLCTSRAMARETNKRLAADNRKLRADFERVCEDLNRLRGGS
jgi:hypothetical protein